MADDPSSPTPFDDAPDWEAIARHFAGESTPEEEAVVRQWLDAHPEEAAAVVALNDATATLARATPPDLDVEAALQRVIARRDAAEVIPIDSRRPPARPVVRAATPARRWSTLAIPAAAAAALLIGVALLRNSADRSGYQPGGGGAGQVVATAVGQRDSVRLPDGTRVLLAPDSRLTVAANYGSDERRVDLQGEAYFDVRHDVAHPFVVRAGSATIRDLGTTFTVHAASGAPVRVAVTSGSVSLAPSGAATDSAVVLQPGDAGALGVDGRTVVDRGGVAESDTAWTRGRLVFREAPVSTVSDELRRWYGIELRVDSAFASRHLSMTFDGESVDRVLDVIALSLGATVERSGDTAVLRAGAGTPR